MAATATAKYKLTDGDIGLPDAYVSGDATQRTRLGRYAQFDDMASTDYGQADLVYVKFTGAVNAGDFVTIDRFNKTATQAPAAAANAKAFHIGISMAVQVAGAFGWVMVRGVHDAANIVNGTGVLTLLSGSGVAGQASTGVANYNFDTARCAQAPVGNVGIAELYWPTVNGR